jgi:myosin-light-chain kinase
MSREANKKIVPPKFYAVPHNKIVEEGDTATFYCTVAGEPFPKVTWDKDNVKIKFGDGDDEEDDRGIKATDKKYRVVVRKDLRILEVFDVSQDDAGLYRVTIENSFGRTQASARLDVLSKKRRSQRSKLQTIH